jgi:hypothetical protein
MSPELLAISHDIAEAVLANHEPVLVGAPEEKEPRKASREAVRADALRFLVVRASDQEPPVVRGTVD